MEATSSSDLLLQQVTRFDVAEGYFAEIISTQTAIFSLIVGIIVALYFYFNWKTSKAQIKQGVEEVAATLRLEIKHEFDEEISKLRTTLKAEIDSHESEITYLTATTYRTLGQFWDSEKDYGVAFIWWMRAAESFIKLKNEKMARMMLSQAKESLDKVKFGFEISTDAVGEYQKLIQKVNDDYRIEKDSIEVALKAALAKK